MVGPGPMRMEKTEEEAAQAAPEDEGEFLIICHCGPGLEYWPANQVLRLEHQDYKEITQLQIDRTLQEYSRSNLSASISEKLFQDFSQLSFFCRITRN